MAINKIGPAKYRVEVSVRVTGKSAPVKRSKIVCGSLSAAKEMEVFLKKEVHESVISADTPNLISMFSDVLDLYQSRRELDKGSWHHVNVLKRELGHNAIDRNLAVEVERYLAALKTQGFAVGTVNRRLAWAKSALNYAVKAGIIVSNPLAGIQKNRERPREVLLSEDDESRLIKAANDLAPHLVPLIMFSLSMPIRVSEAVNAKRDQICESNGGMVLRVKCKGDWGAWKRVPPECEEYFRSLPDECEYVFYRKQGAKYLPLGDFRGSWKRVVAAARLPTLRYHDLRHAAVSKLADFGNTTQSIKQAAGWRTDMLKAYYHWDDRSAANTLRFPVPREVGTKSVQMLS